MPDQIFRDDGPESDHFVVDSGYGPGHVRHVARDATIDVLLVHLHDFRTPLVPPHRRRRHLLAVVQSERIGKIGIRVRLRLVVVGMIRSLFITARTGTQGFDAQLIHHVLVILIGGEGDRRRHSRFGVLSQQSSVGADRDSGNNQTSDDQKTHAPSGDRRHQALESIYFGTNTNSMNSKCAVKKYKSFVLLVALFSVSSKIQAQTNAGPQNWIASWGASQQVPEPQNMLPSADLQDATVRQIFHLSAGGPELRVHVSNAFGTDALQFTAVHIARPISPHSSAIDTTTDKALTFAGKPDVIVPPGAEFMSDPIPYPVEALSDLAVTFYLESPPARETGHPGSRATSYFMHGNTVATQTLVDAHTVDHWYQISEIDVQAAPGSGSVVALGDSITDGHGATTNGNDRWTDVLASRLQQSPTTRNIGVFNAGIGGNHLLTDGLGPNALARFDRDVLAPAGVRWLIVFEGVNDLGGLTRTGEVPPAEHAALVQRLIAAYQQIIARAHAHGLRVIGATITPYAGSDYYHPGPLNEKDRQTVNEWIRATGHFDAVIDFDAVVRDPHQPDHLLPAYDCGDHLHPSPAGYRAMGEAISLSLFAH